MMLCVQGLRGGWGFKDIIAFSSPKDSDSFLKKYAINIKKKF